MRCLKYFVLLMFNLPAVGAAGDMGVFAYSSVNLHDFFVQRFSRSSSVNGMLRLLTVQANAKSNDEAMSSQQSTKQPVKSKRLTMLDGRDVFMQHCMQCHLSSDQTAPQLANAEDWSWRVKSGVDFLVRATIAGKPYHEAPPQGLLGLSSANRYDVDQVRTVPTGSSDQRVRGCQVPRGGCADCSDAEIIAVVKYMVQAAATDNSNYSLW